MDETYKNVAEEFHLQSGKPSEDIPLIGMKSLSTDITVCSCIKYALATESILKTRTIQLLGFIES